MDVGTIDDDDIPDVQEESSTDDEQPVKTKKLGNKAKKKKDRLVAGEFSPGFNFAIDDPYSSASLDFGKAIESAAKGRDPVPSVAVKIAEKLAQAKRRKRKRPVASEESSDISGESGGEGDDGNEDSHAVNESIGCYADSSSSSDEEDQLKEAEKAAFFEQPPPQVMTHSFTQMNLSRPLLKAVSSLGFVHPTPIQAANIPVALAGKDVCACAATGTGKTAAFMLPVIERLLFRPQQNAIRVLVLLPTRELAVQVHAVAMQLAKHTSISICLAAGGLELKKQEVALRQGPDVVIATPGRLVDHLHNTPSFDLQSIEILILDEADRMLEEHFREQLDEIIRLCPRGRQTMLFSATMTDEVQELISLSLNQPVRLFINNNTQVASNLQQEFVRVRANRENDRRAIIAAMCCRTFTTRCMLFVPTKVLAHRLRIELGLLGLKVAELHGSLTQLQRLEALESFKKNTVDVLIATDLAARGLDISGVKTVLNFSMPMTVKSYVHRVGRTARAGQFGRSVTLVGEKERKMLKAVVKQAKNPVKLRVVPPEVIDKYVVKLQEMERDVKDILKQEAQEKEMRVAEMEVNKARNMVEHQAEIFSRPARTWFQAKGQDQAQSKPVKTSKLHSKLRKEVKMDKEQLQLKRETDYIRREAKRAQRPKKHYVIPPDDGAPLKKKKRHIVLCAGLRLPDAGTKKKTGSFDQEMHGRSGKKARHGGSSRHKAPLKSRKRFKKRR